MNWSVKNEKNSLCISGWDFELCSDMYSTLYQICCWNVGSIQGNSGMDHLNYARKVSRYLQGTNEHILTYKRSDQLEVNGYSDSDYAGSVDSRK